MATVDDRMQKIIQKYGSKDKRSYNPEAPLTPAQRKFLECMVDKEMPGNQALVEAYPTWANKTIQQQRAQVCCIMKKPKIQAIYNEMMENKREALVAEAKWTRDTAIEALKYIYNVNRQEHERVDETYNQHIDFLLMKIEASADLVEKQKLLDNILKLRKERRASQINNNAMIQAVAELNKMHGYNSERLVIEDESISELDKRLAQLSNTELKQLIEGENASNIESDRKTT